MNHSAANTPAKNLAPSNNRYRTTEVAVRGGTLHTAIWGPEDPAAPPNAVAADAVSSDWGRR